MKFQLSDILPTQKGISQSYILFIKMSPFVSLSLPLSMKTLSGETQKGEFRAQKTDTLEDTRFIWLSRAAAASF